MLHHHGGAGSPYMAPETAGTGTGTAPFSPTPTGLAVSVTAAIPALPTMQLQPAGSSANFEELAAGGSGAGVAVRLQDEDMQADLGASGAGASGNRWPREETLALIRIRTEMDADFRSSPLKAPLWENVARKLAGLGYHRSAKKCKEKFENVDKYYRRTKDARAGRQDGKSYRFFSQLEALHASAPPLPPPPSGMTTVQAGPHQPMEMAWTAGPTVLGPAAVAGLPDLSFSSMSESDSEYDSDDDDDDSGAGEEGLSGGECDREMMATFERMMKQFTEKQDAMQRVFLETLERCEAERTAREEAWRRQEVARMNREREQLARERAAAASRDAALIAFLQRVGGGQGEPARLPPHGAGVVPPPPMPDCAPPSPRRHAAAASLQQLVPVPPKAVEALARAGGEGGGSTPSRWPKEEVEALIQMRNEKGEKYHDAGAKGPLWEDIAAAMRGIGYSRSAKRCKEKWENINKYYKKVKESNKRRPEDSKTCPYFHQLDAMYRNKHRSGTGGRTAPRTNMASAVAVAATVQDNPSKRELEGKSSNDADNRKNDEQGNVLTSPASGDTAPDGRGQCG
ncbi:Putative homeodomain-like transcription factor superfamily protein isoform 1 [Zea mays]|uniref:Putative homeodomain-like transcription factor superfamily protein isoform 1 n=2 Tax=Zea mays TaxID=4577 RepID=A0A1D6Q673_MAIZE|nr:Putative homeodomain-like transcription factor superfamily protein isoform 1 [Zea mays]AQK54016.1 Putative homeodomain-like transcription factor superfamily protein isoform 1 [Zea mays]